MEKTLNKDTKEKNQEKEEKITVEEDVSLDTEENDSIEVPEEISQEEIIKDLEDQLLRAKAEVQNVRIESLKSTGGSIEVFILEIKSKYIAKCLVKSNDKKNINKKYVLKDFIFQIIDILDDTFVIKFNKPVIEIIDIYGKTPLPPYIEDDPTKYKYYNNQFANGGFSVASPTAGLHFTNNQINNLINDGHKFIYINLDVNIDTFKPITERYLENHKIHEENYQINEKDFEIILEAKESQIDIYCVGTTSLRAIESAFLTGKLSGSTDYFIYPDDYKWNFKLKEFLIIKPISSSTKNFFIIT